MLGKIGTSVDLLGLIEANCDLFLADCQTILTKHGGPPQVISQLS